MRAMAHPEIVRKYGEYLWFDPGEPEAADHFIAVLNDVVKRYDIDGVHIDDYFYPYQIQGRRREDRAVSRTMRATSGPSLPARRSSATIGGGRTSTTSSSGCTTK